MPNKKLVQNGKVVKYRRKKPDSVTKVEPLLNEHDFTVGYLAQYGAFAVSVIAEETGYSENQVRHRMKRYGVKLGDWRKGRSPEAKEIIKRGKTAASKAYTRQLEARMRKQFKDAGWIGPGQ